MERTASFSRDRRYRYALGRRWGEGPAVTWVMLNPSTADHRQDDPTIRRCIAFSRSWGFGSLRVVNLFALRSSTPRALLDVSDALGPRGSASLRRGLQGGEAVVAAWGNVPPRLADRANAVRMLLPERTWCLGLTGRGEPRHPLYVRASTALVGLSGEASTLSVLGGPPTMAA